MSRRFHPLLVVALLCLVLSGCTRKSVDGEVTTVVYETWVAILAILGGVGAAVLSFVFRSRGLQLWVLLIASVLATLLFLPFGFVDYVRVSPERLETRWGFWCFPTLHNIAFDDVRGVQLTKKVSSGRRGRKNTSYNLDFQLADGRVESISATNDLVEEAVDEILQPLAERGIHLVDLTGEL